MSWTNELYAVYELACGTNDSLLPIFHIKAKSQIEVLLNKDGEFRGASIVNPDDADTIVPDTGRAKTGKNPPPYPFAESLKYLAGDWNDYAKEILDNTKFYEAYISQLKYWNESIYTHTSVNAVYQYISKAELISDLLKCGILQCDPETSKLPEKQLKCTTEKLFVRFIILYDDSTENQTWKDKTLYDSFISYNQQNAGNNQLCYATGKILPVMDVHPYGIVKSNARAKLISSNDDKGFTFRGRFADKNEALSISADFSQKMHNALKWLITNQGQSYGSLTLVTWASSLAALPNELGKQPIEDEWDEEEAYDSLPLYKKKLQQHLLGYGANYPPDAKVMLLGLDAATTGRLSIAVYAELQASDFLGNLEHWHGNCAWMRYDGKHKTNCIRSFSLYEIIRAAYGTEQNGKLECDEKLTSEQILRLLPCVMNGRPVPYDLVQALYRKASNPLAYEQPYIHRLVIETACGMYRAFLKGEISMGYDPNETDRSYLYGCLLAIADKAESDTYEDADKLKRVTNARRYWANFAQRPYQTWQTIEERLRPYLNHHNFRVQAEKWMQEIMGKFTPGSFADNSRLDPMYLLGYHHFMEYMWKKNQDMKEEN